MTTTTPSTTRSPGSEPDERDRPSPGLIAAVLAAVVVLAVIARPVITRRYATGVSGAWFPVALWSVLLATSVVIGAIVLASTFPSVRRRWALPIGFRFWIAGICAAAFLIRFAGLFRVATDQRIGAGFGDPDYYQLQSNMLADGRGFGEPFTFRNTGRLIPTAIHPPGFSAYLAIFSKLGARAVFDHKMAAFLLGVAAVAVIGYIGRRVGGDAVGLLAAGLAAISPSFWLPDGIIMPEGAFILCCALVILFAYRWREHPVWQEAAALGLFIGLSALARGEGVLLGPVLALPWILSFRKVAMRTRLLHLAGAGVACLLVLAPWMVRNLNTFANFVPLSTNSNEVIEYANCPDSYYGEFAGYWSFNCQERIRQEQGEFAGDESERAAAWRQVGVTYAREHAGRLPVVLAMRFGRVWNVWRPLNNARLSTIEGRNLRSQQIALALQAILTPMAIAGWWILRRRGTPSWPLVAQAVCVTLTAMYAYGADRFRAPAEITLVVLSAVTAVWLVDRWRSTRSRQAGPELAEPSGGG